MHALKPCQLFPAFPRHRLRHVGLVDTLFQLEIFHGALIGLTEFLLNGFELLT